MTERNITEWTHAVDEVTQSFRETFGSLDAEQLNRKPDPKSWSVGQIMDHLIVVNRTYDPILEQVWNGSYKKPFMARFSGYVRFMGRFILQGVQPSNRRKVKTFAIWQPAESNIPGDIPDRFAAQQEELKQKIERSASCINHGIVISSPANKNIVYSLETAFDIIVAHEKRHLQQAKETWNAVKDLQPASRKCNNIVT